jgi:hypothetical protein
MLGEIRILSPQNPERLRFISTRFFSGDPEYGDSMLFIDDSGHWILNLFRLTDHNDEELGYAFTAKYADLRDRNFIERLRRYAEQISKHLDDADALHFKIENVEEFFRRWGNIENALKENYEGNDDAWQEVRMLLGDLFVVSPLIEDLAGTMVGEYDELSERVIVYYPTPGLTQEDVIKIFPYSKNSRVIGYPDYIQYALDLLRSLNVSEYEVEEAFNMMNEWDSSD